MFRPFRPALVEALEPRQLLSVQPLGSGDAIGLSVTPLIAEASGNVDDRRFLKQLFLDLLHRPATAMELSFYGTPLAAGGSRQDVVQAVIAGPDFRRSAVQDQYQALLRRAAAANEVDAWSAQLGGGLSLREFRALLLASEEYFQRFAGSDNASFVNAIFQDVLGRAASSNEQASFVQQINAGLTRPQVAWIVANSPEAAQMSAAVFFHQYLRRQAGSSEITAVSGLIQGGQNDEQVMALIFASEEYYLNASTGIIVTGTEAGAPPNVRVFNASTGQLQRSFFAYDPAYLGGVRVASADVNGDGFPDIITAPGQGAPPNVRVFDGLTGQPLPGPLGSFFAYDPEYLGGTYVAAGDVDGDGYADIITGVGVGAPPNVRVYSGADGSLLRSFFAYDAGFLGGVRVAAGDVNGDGRADLIAAPGSATSQVAVFSGADQALLASFFAFEPNFGQGMFVASGDVNGDGRDDVLTSAANGSTRVALFSATNFSLLSSYEAFASFPGGTRLAAVDVDRDGLDDLLATPGPGAGPHVRARDNLQDSDLLAFLAYDLNYLGGTYLAGGRR